jgi:hypothetical protein
VTSQPVCDLCAGRLADTAYVCSPCTDKTRADLLRIAELATEVEAAILKLVRYGGSGQGSGERPVPWDDVRAGRAAAVGNTVSTWARHVAESHGIPVEPPRVPRAAGPLCYHGQALPLLDRAKPPCRHYSCAEIGTRRSDLGVAIAASWLAEHGQMEWLRHQREAAEAMAELREAAREVERIVDRPRDRWYAGPCWEDLPTGGRCEVELYAVPGARVVRCRECRAEHDAAGRKAWLLAEARDVLAHAALIAAALTALGMPVAVGTVYSWASRGRIVAHGSDTLGRPLYKVGEALDLLSSTSRRVA